MKDATRSFPADDDEFEDSQVIGVSKDEGSWNIKRTEGWYFCVPETSPIEPKIGMRVRFYGKGIGYTVRGLFIDGVKVFYRTAAEDKEHYEIQTYGADADDWLKRWDDGGTVWSVSMGGLGPGYEQCIHITAAEILRHLLACKYDHCAWSDSATWKRDTDAIRSASFKNKRIDALGPSGAQFGAAMSLATRIYIQGPRAVMSNPQVKDRLIQVSRTFPSWERA